MQVLRDSQSWIDYICMYYCIDREVVDLAIDKFDELNNATHDYDLLPIRKVRNEFIGYLKRLLSEDEEIITLKAKAAYKVYNTPQFKRFIDILFGVNSSKEILYNVLSVQKQLSEEDFISLLPAIRGMGWEKFTDMMIAMNNKKSYTYGAVSLYALIVRWLKNIS